MTNLIENYLSESQVTEVLARLNHIDPSFIPAINTKAFMFLALLVLNRLVTKDLAMSVLRDDPRSPRQTLTGKFRYWSLYNIGEKSAVYMLDERHLTGSTDDDLAARFDSKLRLTKTSFKQSEREGARREKAWQEYEECQTGQLNLRI